MTEAGLELSVSSGPADLWYIDVIEMRGAPKLEAIDAGDGTEIWAKARTGQHKRIVVNATELGETLHSITEALLQGLST